MRDSAATPAPSLIVLAAGPNGHVTLTTTGPVRSGDYPRVAAIAKLAAPLAASHARKDTP